MVTRMDVHLSSMEKSLECVHSPQRSEAPTQVTSGFRSSGPWLPFIKQQPGGCQPQLLVPPHFLPHPLSSPRMVYLCHKERELRRSPLRVAACLLMGKCVCLVPGRLSCIAITSQWGVCVA